MSRADSHTGSQVLWLRSGRHQHGHPGPAGRRLRIRL